MIDRKAVARLSGDEGHGGHARANVKTTGNLSPCAAWTARRLTLVAMRLREPLPVENLHVAGAAEIAHPACDLRTQLVQWLRDAAHSPDARARAPGINLYL